MCISGLLFAVSQSIHLRASGTAEAGIMCISGLLFHDWGAHGLRGGSGTCASAACCSTILATTRGIHVEGRWSVTTQNLKPL